MLVQSGIVTLMSSKQELAFSLRVTFIVALDDAIVALSAGVGGTANSMEGGTLSEMNVCGPDVLHRPPAVQDVTL
jgi:hypothetical protein